MTEQTNQMEHVKVLIIGSGPAGYTAALYTGRASLQPVLYCGPLTGGQLTQTTEIENFPGYPQGVDANQMMLEFREQAERFGADIRDGEVESCDFSQRPYRVKFTDGTQMTADTVIIATGASAKYLGLDDEKKYAGQGVSACAVCDGFFYRKKVTAVVGGGDTACEDALYLANLCKKVYLVVRKPYLRASEIMQDRVKTIPTSRSSSSTTPSASLVRMAWRVCTSSSARARPTSHATTSRSMASSSPSATIPTPTSSVVRSTSTRWASS